jgi:hypothetical protein
MMRTHGRRTTTTTLPLTRRLMEDKGYDFGITEHRILSRRRRHGFVSKDLFGLMDAVAMNDDEHVGVQSTSRRCVMRHIDEYGRDEAKLSRLLRWLRNARFIIVWWKKPKSKNEKWSHGVVEAHRVNGSICWEWSAELC